MKSYFLIIGVDATNQQLIIKDKRNNKYKIVKPMSDKWHDGLFYHLLDNNGNKTYINHEYLIYCYSLADIIVNRKGQTLRDVIMKKKKLMSIFQPYWANY